MSPSRTAARKNIWERTSLPGVQLSPCAPSGGCTRRPPQGSPAVPSRRQRRRRACGGCRGGISIHSPWWASREEEGGINTEFTEDTEITEKTGKRTGRAGQAPPLQICTDRVLSSMLKVAFLGFVEEIFGGAPGERHDRERGILVRIGDRWRAIGDEQILHVVRLAEAIEHGSFRVRAHARSAHLVNNLA